MVIRKKGRILVLFTVTIGGILEWYEIFLFTYWANVIGDLFFPASLSNSFKIIDVFLLFAFGFLSRPIGGIIFGRLGDRRGRKIAFLFSIIAISIPSVLIGVLPSYATWGISSALILGILRFLQGIPAGGELPGAMCYLAEIAPKSWSRFFCSFVFIGPQIGGIIGMGEAWFFESFYSSESLAHGLRISFILGGLIGLLGACLRKKLRETHLFMSLEKKENISLKRVFFSFNKKIAFMFFISFLEVVGYFLVAVFPVVYFDSLFGISRLTNLLISASLLSFSAITIPFFGMIGDRINNKKLLITSALGVICFSIPFYFSVNARSLLFTIISEAIIILFMNVQFALLPSLLVNLAPIRARFTCLGISFNLCDSIIGGLVTCASLFLVYHTENPGSFIGILVVAAVISLIGFFCLKKEHYNGFFNT